MHPAPKPSTRLPDIPYAVPTYAVPLPPPHTHTFLAQNDFLINSTDPLAITYNDKVGGAPAGWGGGGAGNYG